MYFIVTYSDGSTQEVFANSQREARSLAQSQARTSGHVVSIVADREITADPDEWLSCQEEWE